MAPHGTWELRGLQLRSSKDSLPAASAPRPWRQLEIVAWGDPPCRKQREYALPKLARPYIACGTLCGWILETLNAKLTQPKLKPVFDSCVRRWGFSTWGFRHRLAPHTLNPQTLSVGVGVLLLLLLLLLVILVLVLVLILLL